MLLNPEEGNYQVAEDSPAQGYGCQTFGEKKVHTKPEIHFSNWRSKSFMEVSGEITEDTFWDADTVLVVGNVSIEEQATLNISAGVQVLFEDFYLIHIIDGNVSAIGNAGEQIRFSSLHPELFSFDETYDGAWQGIFFDNVPAACSESRFEYCVFEYSKAVSESRIQGGVIHIDGSNEIIIENSIFRSNVAYYGGAIATSSFANPLLISSLFYQNYNLLKGAAFYISNSYPKLINNTIVDNHSLNPDGNDETAAVFTYFSKPKFLNNIIRQNSTTFFEFLQIRENKSYYTRNNNIEQAIAGFGNINFPAEFLDFEEQNYSLTEISPCIDAGYIFEEYDFPQLDLAGIERIYGNSIDIGSYEYHPDSAVPDQSLSFIPMQIYPNPFNANSTIRFYLPETRKVKLCVFNCKGQKVNTLVNAQLSQGEHRIFWNGKTRGNKQAGSGVYLFHLEVDGHSFSTQKSILLK